MDLRQETAALPVLAVREQLARLAEHHADGVAGKGRLGAAVGDLGAGSASIPGPHRFAQKT
jgi:hypothetical protein